MDHRGDTLAISCLYRVYIPAIASIRCWFGDLRLSDNLSTSTSGRGATKQIQVDDELSVDTKSELGIRLKTACQLLGQVTDPRPSNGGS